jgi:hypothetical protein
MDSLGLLLYLATKEGQVKVVSAVEHGPAQTVHAIDEFVKELTRLRQVIVETENLDD